MTFNLVTNPSKVFVETAEGWIDLQHSGQGKWSKNNIFVQTLVEGQELKLKLESTKEAIHSVKFRWGIDIDRPISVLGDHWERAYGDLEWRGVVPERIMPWYFLTNDQSVTSGYGVKTGANSFCYWQMDSEGITLTSDIRCGNQGVILGARKLDIAAVIVHEGDTRDTAFETARQFCKRMCENPRLPKQPVYGGNNWYYAYGSSSHEEILEDSRFISSLADSKENRPFMVIDDGWQYSSGGGACNGGPWIGNERFPDMLKLANEMKEIGVKPGIWFRPLMVSQEVPHEWIRFVNSDGKTILDPSVPEVRQYIAESIKNMVSWGFDLIKHDFTTFDVFGKWGFQMKSDMNGTPYTFKDRSKTTAEIIKELYQVIADASGECLIIGCNTISHLGAGLFEIQRTGDDTSGKSWERTRYMGINTLAFRMPQHGTFYSHDADCIGITSQISWELNHQWLDLLAGSGTPLFVSVDPSIVTEQQKVALRDAFTIASEEQSPGEPMDWLSTTSPRHWMLNGKKTKFEWNELSVTQLTSQDNHWWK